MTREEAKQLLPVIQAYAEGKDMQLCCDGTWLDAKYQIPFDNITHDEIRIKPEPTYRAFESQEECWQEMQKHQPFGWVKNIEDDGETWYENITSVMCDSVGYTDRGNGVAYDEFMRGFSFADGTPFGIKEGGEQ